MRKVDELVTVSDLPHFAYERGVSVKLGEDKTYVQFYDKPEVLSQISKLINSIGNPSIKVKHIHYQLYTPTLVIELDEDYDIWVSEGEYVCVDLDGGTLEVLSKGIHFNN